MRYLNWMGGSCLLVAFAAMGCGGDDGEGGSSSPGSDAGTDGAVPDGAQGDGSSDDGDVKVDAGADVSAEAGEDAAPQDAALDGGQDALPDVDLDAGDCVAGQAWNPYATPPGCVDCSRDCNLEGEAGYPYPITAQNGTCVCDTLPGYYFSLSGSGTANKCDDDGDGWTTLSARPNILSQDPAIAATAKCDVRTIDRVVLVTEGADPSAGVAVSLSDLTDLGITSLDLYEENKRDDQSLLDNDANAPAYGTAKLRAEEVNSLTKICANATGDYNANGEPDIAEYDTLTVTSQPGWIPEVTALYQAYTRFSYFVELHRGWFENGAYYIQEKDRDPSANAAWKVPVTYGGSASFWNACERFIDTAFDPNGETVGMDFARYDGAPYYDAKMLHHSQFKCIEIVSGSASQPYQVESGELSNYAFNSCSVSGTSDPVQGTLNPNDPILGCATASGAQGDVGFAGVRYLDYDGDNYVRGCVNQCVEAPDLCPGYVSTMDIAVLCDGDVNDFGKIVCLDNVFVSSTGDDAAAGTADAPLQTIQAGIDMASSQGKNGVIVGEGTYAGTITMNNGVSVKGSFDPTTWKRPDPWPNVDPTTVITADAGIEYGHRVGVNAADISDSTDLDGVKIDVSGTPAKGQSNYGILFRNASAVSVSNVTIDVGNAGAGDAGEQGAAGTATPASAKGGAGTPWDYGAPDTAGCSACGCFNSAIVGGKGGSAVSCSSGATSEPGGAGGGWKDGVCPVATLPPQGLFLGEPGEPGGGSDGNWGVGGKTQRLDSYPLQCSVNILFVNLFYKNTYAVGDADGANGVDGSTGVVGAGGVAAPTFDASTGLFVVGDGTGGLAGAVGRGGGGGGGGTTVFVPMTLCPVTTPRYPSFAMSSGGGGGAGGCPGLGGTAGRGGGAAFGLLFHNSHPSLSNMVISVGDGGSGGPGADGGNGRAGGLGAQGGTSLPPSLAGAEGAVTFIGDSLDLSAGGDGGKGGKGGKGGPGGGGAGGPSYCLYKSTTGNDPVVNGVTCSHGNGGLGGTAPTGGNTGADGLSGQSNW